MYKHSFLFLLTLFFWADTFNSARTVFSYYDRLGIVVITLTVLLFQFFLLNNLASKTQSKLTKNIAYGVIITFNAYCLNLSQMGKFIQSSPFLKIIVLLVVIFILTALLNLMDEIKKARPLILVLVLLLLAGKAIRPIVPNITKLLIKPPDVSSLVNYKPVEFQIKPNLYIVFFDSIVPETILEKYLGVKKVLYHDVLNKNFHRFRNFFTDSVPTMRTLNKFLALDEKYYADLESEWIGLFQGLSLKTHRKAELFQGKTESPLLKIFKQNGYETNTIYNSTFFGVKKGPHVDNYFMREEFSACSRMHKEGLGLEFFGYCHISANPSINKLLNPQPLIDFIIDKFRKGLFKPKPQIFVTYIFSPGHTGANYNHKNEDVSQDYIENYKTNSKTTASHLTKILNFVKNEDPSGLIYVLGDHGPWLSRQESSDAEFLVQDRYAVYGGFYPPDKCQSSFSKPYSQGFITGIQGVYMIIRCLSGGENAFYKLDNYNIKYNILDKLKGNDSYANYLYE
jgi:hypothetical protein